MSVFSCIRIAPQSSNELGLQLTMAIMTTFVPYSLMSMGLKRVGAGDASVVLLLTPVSASILSTVFLSEGIGLLSGIGSGLILLSVVILAVF